MREGKGRIGKEGEGEERWCIGREEVNGSQCWLMEEKEGMQELWGKGKNIFVCLTFSIYLFPLSPLKFSLLSLLSFFSFPPLSTLFSHC